jgi:hypothetical protein
MQNFSSLKFYFDKFNLFKLDNFINELFRIFVNSFLEPALIITENVKYIFANFTENYIKILN